MFCNLYCWHYCLLQEAIEVGKKRKREQMEEVAKKIEETKEVIVLTSKTQSSAQETKGVTAAPPKKRRWFDEEEALLEELSDSEEDTWCHGVVYPIPCTVLLYSCAIMLSVCFPQKHDVLDYFVLCKMMSVKESRYLLGISSALLIALVLQLCRYSTFRIIEILLTFC